MASDVADERIRAIEPLTAQKKIHRSALRETELNVIFHRDVPFEDARAAILASGAALADPFAVAFAPSNRIRVRIAGASLDALAADDRVLVIAGPNRLRAEPDNATSADLSHVPEVLETPYGLSGEGVAVSLFEFGRALTTHVEFDDRFTAPAIRGTSGNESHATHVAGTIGATGVDASAKGMAPRVAIHELCIRHPSNDCTGDWLEIKDQELAAQGIVVDNNSWSFRVGWSSQDGVPVWNGAEYLYGAYDLTRTAPLDAISLDRGVLFVHSAGNNGQLPSGFGLWFGHRHTDDEGNVMAGTMFCYSDNGLGTDCPVEACSGGCETTRHTPLIPYDTMSMTGAAKNVIAVGALDASSIIALFSSRGPAKDGRVKPDVVARGTAVYSTTAGGGYARMSGTSMSTPVVTGIAALLVEQWRRVSGGVSPTPAQLKALILAGTDDVGNPGPDYTYGFGLVNAKRSVDAILDRRIRTFDIAQAETREIELIVTEPQNVRVLLHWADPAIPFLGDDSIAAKALVNDLDVTVIDPAGNTIHPYVLAKENHTANATTGVNTVDNTEMLEIANATPGAYRIRVRGTDVAEGPQTAVLVTSAEMGEGRPKRRAVR